MKNPVPDEIDLVPLVAEPLVYLALVDSVLYLADSKSVDPAEAAIPVQKRIYSQSTNSSFIIRLALHTKGTIAI